MCLSLLGTSQGGRGESWSPEYSTVLQVLISIQVGADVSRSGGKSGSERVCGLGWGRQGSVVGVRV